jgi:uncharacterized membrane protein
MTSQLIFSAFTVIVETFLSYLYYCNSNVPVSKFLLRLYSVIHGNNISKQRREANESEDDVMYENLEMHSALSNRGSRRYRKRNCATTSSVHSRRVIECDCYPPPSNERTSFTINLERKAFILMLGFNFICYIISLIFFLA